MKHIRAIDNIDNLRALIRHDLREFGIKVPKPKKSKRGGSKLQQDVSKSSIFGNHLAQVHCVHVPECGYVAKFLIDAADIILANIESEGIFRKSGSLTRQKEIRAQLDNGKGFVDATVHDVTALVKQFFRELPEPLFTSTYHDTFVRCYQLEDPDAARKAILLLCHMLPGEHISTLQYILKLLAKIAANSAANKMDSTNLAVVLAPNIMHVNSKTETMKSCEEKLLQVQTSVVEMLISSADQVGMVADQLVERTQFMSEVFTTDDELDASDDNLEDTRENRKKEKKRKRSGSFQGFVSSIAQSITKWRRSTDGKTNTSGFSAGSNLSQVSTASHPHTSDDVLADRDVNSAVYQFSAMENTPVVRRKAVNMETMAFSATKKKAIIQNLPQHATLASTPYTPASTMKRMEINSVRRTGLGDMPSMPPRPYQCTPRHSMKTPRKKLTLFSPASSMKKKRYSSTTNLSVQSEKKATKSKGIFRRLSGSRGDQTVPATAAKTRGNHEVGQRLASPSSMFDASLDASEIASTHDDATNFGEVSVRGTRQHSTSLCEQSVISTCDDHERASLNEGFIFSGDDKDVDISRMLSETVSEPALCGSETILYGSHDITGGCFSIGSAPHIAHSDTAICIGSTPKGLNRSYSADSVVDSSMKMGMNRTTPNTSLRRGAPNTINMGLLHGDRSEVQKLRRSFGLDKSDIGYPIPISVANVTCRTDNSFDDSLNDGLNTTADILDNKIVGESIVTNADVQMLDKVNSDSPGSISQSQSTTSAASINVNDKSSKNCDHANGYEGNIESVAGFTASGATTVVAKKTVNTEKSNESEKPVKKKTLAEQSYESVDSLFSNVSASSPPVQLNQREMTRSISADSGKGSMCEEPMDDADGQDMATPTPQTVATNNANPAQTVAVNSADPDEPAHKEPAHQDLQCLQASVLDSTITSNLEVKPTMPNKKSHSSQDLQVQVNRTPGVSRSKSLLDGSMAKKNLNGGRPNLQISAETHKLLARAGYIREQSEETPDEQESFSGSFQLEQDDFVVPGPLLQLKLLKNPEDFNPRRESIIQLRKSHAGYVKSNIKQFDRISETGPDIAERHASPFRFPSSTTRKRGLSPLSIPRAFATTKHVTNSSKQSKCDNKLLAGTARVPISTQLIKPVPAFASKESIMDTTVPMKRKPSIYYAKKEGISAVNKYKNQLNKSATKNGDIQEVDETNASAMDTDSPNDTINEHDNSKVLNGVDAELLGASGKGILGGQSVELNHSLMETVNSVCTPLSEKLLQNSGRIGMINKENLDKSVDSKPNRQMPEIKSLLVNPLSVENIALRTASGKTPVTLLRSSQSPRSPVKPLKRLGGSPRSPRCRNLRSPKLVKPNRSLLTALQSQDEDLNNL